jgi:DNA-binding CsgD family transcriptional regulator
MAWSRTGAMLPDALAVERFSPGPCTAGPASNQHTWLSPVLPGNDVGDAFLRAVEIAHDIASPQQLFWWLRLHLHRFVPHDLLLTRLHHDPCTGGRRAQVLNSVALPAGVQDELSAPSARFWGALEEAWHAAGQTPVWLSLRDMPLLGLASQNLLLETGVEQVLVHGLLSPSRQYDDVLVAFMQCGAAQAGRDGDSARCLALWMPYLHFALHRSSGTLGNRKAASLTGSTSPRPLTSRELQVLLAVREAKANAQIAVQLGISPLTVKNHLRSIQKKLGARNRAHAVAEAMSLRLIS